MIHERARDDRETDVRARAPTYFRGGHAVCNSRALPENGTGERNVSCYNVRGVPVTWCHLGAVVVVVVVLLSVLGRCVQAPKSV